MADKRNKGSGNKSRGCATPTSKIIGKAIIETLQGQSILHSSQFQKVKVDRVHVSADL